MPVNLPVTGSAIKSALPATTSGLVTPRSNTARSQVETPKTDLKRKRSLEGGFFEQESKQMAESLPSPSQHLDDVGPDQKRTKLGYHRTSIACGHCRHRKIRCLVAAGDESCTNCIRLKKDCFFHPVEPSQVKSKPRGKRSTSQLEKRRTLPIPSEESHSLGPRKRYSDSSVPYAAAARGLNTQGFADTTGLIFEEPKPVSESTLETYNSLLDPSMGTGLHGFPVLQTCDEPQDSYGMGYSRHSISHPAVSPRTQYHGLSPSPHPDFNQQITMPSPQITFTSDLHTPDWGKPLPSSSYESFTSHQAMLSPRGSRQQLTASIPQLDLTSMKSHLMPHVTEYPIFSSDEMQVPLSAVSSLSVPALSISQSVSPFSEHNAWSGFTPQESNPAFPPKGFDDYIPESQWFPFQ